MSIFGSLFMVVFVFMFMAVFAFIVFVGIKVFKQSTNYKKQPVLTVHAKLIEKRIYARSSYTYYYGTFELESGDRMELILPTDKAGLIIEGDEGELTFQGDRYIDFGYDDKY